MDSYFVNGYWWMVILLMVIRCYSINDSFVNDYLWIFY